LSCGEHCARLRRRSPRANSLAAACAARPDAAFHDALRATPPDDNNNFTGGVATYNGADDINNTFTVISADSAVMVGLGPRRN
jgi:hypothetical protein